MNPHFVVFFRHGCPFRVMGFLSGCWPANKKTSRFRLRGGRIGGWKAGGSKRMGDTPGDDDATLVRRIAEERDERALAELLERHAPKVTGDLRHRFRHQLQHPDIDEA